jgi:hypothetical protein
MTPYEAWLGKKQSVAHLRKLEDRRTRMMFIGYDGVQNLLGTICALGGDHYKITIK